LVSIWHTTNRSGRPGRYIAHRFRPNLARVLAQKLYGDFSQATRVYIPMNKTPLIALLLVGACGDDPVQFSEPVGIELKAKSGDVANSAVKEDKGITTESGNPYGKFISDAMAKLGGKDPSEIHLDKLTLTLGAQSTNVTALEQVLTGDGAVTFLTNDTNNTFVAAHCMNPTGVGPFDCDVAFDWSQVGSGDVPKMLAGSFKVGLTAPAAAGFDTKGAEASLQLTMTFTAFE
jgi:hypothetical protein